jgi:aminoglycoside phosphotransferase (APT) family kinase protein
VIGIEALSPTQNSHFLVTDAAGTQVILRHYRRTRSRGDPGSRLKRERWALTTLTAAGAPVPRLLTSSEAPGAEAILMELAEGAVLGSLVRRLPPAEAESAWRAAGRALAAVHAVGGRAAEAAGCEQAGIRAPRASRGPYHYDEARASLERLASSRPDLAGLRALTELVEEARPQYERAPLAVCQYDVHLWQFVLARRGSEWECTAILDWETVDLDDPDWDLAQLDGFRFEEVGPTPPAFFAAYGREPRGLYALYRLERAAWILDAFARGEDWLALSVPPAEAYLRKVVAELG